MREMTKQMEMFQDGGLKDEGNTVDPVSGNDVPPGATQEEVRDDIPAQLSEGEFVFPADVVRYIGLEKLMRLRQEAKMGLKMMEEMGQMGNADEATIPDDIPFSVIDINIAEDDEDEEVEKRAEGGVIEAANGFAGTTTTTNPLQQRQPNVAGAQTGIKTPYVAPTIPTATAAPIGGFKYKSPIDTTKKATYTGLFGGEDLTQGPDEYRTYVNDAGAEIQIPFKNGELFTGFTIPEGFKQKTEDVTAKPQTTRIQTARVEPTQSDDDPEDTITGATDLTGAPLSYLSMPFSKNMDALDKELYDIAFTQSRLFDPREIAKVGAGKVNANDIILNSITPVVKSFKDSFIVGREVLKLGRNHITGEDIQLQEGFNLADMLKTDRDRLAQKIATRRLEVERAISDRDGNILSKKDLDAKFKEFGIERPKLTGITRQDRKNLSKAVSDLVVKERQRNKKIAEAQRKAGEQRQKITKRQPIVQPIVQQQDSGDGGISEPDYGSGGIEAAQQAVEDATSEYGGGESFVGIAKGGLLKKKPKPKKMKRGGLASR